MAYSKRLLLALLPLLAVSAEPGALEVGQELAVDDECRDDVASSSSPECALSALQLRQGVAMGDASGGIVGKEASNEATPEQDLVAAEEDKFATKVDKVAAEADKDSAETDEDAAEADEDAGEADKAVTKEDDATAEEAPPEKDLFIMSHLMLAATGKEDEDCPKDTGGSCRFLTCDSSRNAFCKKTGCHQSWLGYDHCYYKCLCPAGYCVRDGACQKQASGGSSVAPVGKVTSSEISDVKNHFGLTSQQANLCVKEFVSTDKGSKGYITADDLVADVQKRGKQVSKTQMEAFINKYDLNHDGKLSFFEFGYMFSQTQKK